MNAIELLLQRQSSSALTSPAPSEKEIETLLAAGMRAPDHGGLQPWHFHVVSGQGLQRLSDLFVEAIIPQISTANLDKQAAIDKETKTAKMPFRAPMLIVVSTKYAEHTKVPKQEQLVAAGCCAHAMQMAAYALGYGAIWRTGDLAYNDLVHKGLGLEEGNDIAGFLYIGTLLKPANLKPAKDYQDHVTYWQ